MAGGGGGRAPAGGGGGGGGGPAGRGRPRLGTGFHAVRGDGYLRLLAGLLLLATITTTLVDLQLKAAARSWFGADRDAMAAFFGGLARWLSLASLAVQLLITPRFLRRFGVGRALFVLPAVMVVGAGAIGFHLALALPLVTAVAIAKIGDGGLRFSLDKAAMELLYVPVPPAARARAKPVIDTVADRAGTAATGLLWLALTVVGGRDAARLVPAAAAATLAVAGVWLCLVVRARRAYLRAFRATLPAPPETKDVRAALQGLRCADPAVRANARELLDNLLSCAFTRRRPARARRPCAGRPAPSPRRPPPDARRAPPPRSSPPPGSRRG